MTHPSGEIEISQSVKAYKASIVLSGDIPEGIWMIISVFEDVLSSTFLILILPLSLAFKILSIRDEVFVP